MSGYKAQDYEEDEHLEEHQEEHLEEHLEEHQPKHEDPKGVDYAAITKEYLELAKVKGAEYSAKYAAILAEEFNRHPKKFKMNCGEHFLVAMKSSLWSLGASVVFAVHAIFPMMFQTTGSDMIASLHKTFEERDRVCEDE